MSAANYPSNFGGGYAAPSAYGQGAGYAQGAFPGSYSAAPTGYAGAGYSAGYAAPAGYAPQEQMAYAPAEEQQVVEQEVEYEEVQYVEEEVPKEKVDVVLEGAFQKIDLVGNQLCAFAAELEELKAEISNSNTFLDRELRTNLQQANDEIYRLRNQLSEYTDVKK